MTDTERERINAICEVAGISEIDDLSDGFHTFRQLYYQRMMLFAVIVKQNKKKAWKSLRHEDGELCFGGGWFIVGIDTPKGSYTYHYENKYFDLFDCEILDYGKHWDGHTEKDVTRLLSLQDGADINVGRKNLIDRRQAVDVIRAMQTYKLFAGDDLILVDKAGVMTELMMLPSAQPKQEWIPVSERLPEDGENVLVTYKTTDKIHPCQYHDDGSRNPWYSYIDQCRAHMNMVLAWMPLPEPYAGKRTKETDCDYERAVEQLEHDILYEPTFNQDDGSM